MEGISVSGERERRKGRGECTKMGNIIHLLLY